MTAGIGSSSSLMLSGVEKIWMDSWWKITGSWLSRLSQGTALGVSWPTMDIVVLHFSKPATSSLHHWIQLWPVLGGQRLDQQSYMNFHQLVLVVPCMTYVSWWWRSWNFWNFWRAGVSAWSISGWSIQLRNRGVHPNADDSGSRSNTSHFIIWRWTLQPNSKNQGTDKPDQTNWKCTKRVSKEGSKHETV